MKAFLTILFLSIVLCACGQKVSNSSQEVYNVVQQMPVCPGGEDSMLHFIYSIMRYPDSAIAHNIQGKLIMGFVVNEDGSISDITVRRGLTADIDSEGVRIVRLLPKFISGKNEGKPVKVNFLLPIIFKIRYNIIDTNSKAQIEHMPEFPGGDSAITLFIRKNLQYPSDAAENDVQGNVEVQFIVNEEGTISNIKVIKPVCPSIDAEAIRIARLLPKFKSGTQQGKPVSVRYILPIMFKLNCIGADCPEKLEYPLQKYLPGVHDTVTIMPEYIGGKEKLMMFLSKKIIYPKDALATNIEGVVVVSFVVNENGKLSDFAIAREAYSSLNIEALRVAKLLPPFKPGILNGKTVKVRYRLPIKFKT